MFLDPTPIQLKPPPPRERVLLCENRCIKHRQFFIQDDFEIVHFNVKIVTPNHLKTRRQEIKQNQSLGQLKRWKRNRDAGVRTRKGEKRLAAVLSEQWELEKRHRLSVNLMRHPVLEDFVSELQTIPTNRLNKRLNQCIPLLTKSQLKIIDEWKEKLPLKPRIGAKGRIGHGWTGIETSLRNKIFCGCYDLDIEKCFLTLVNWARSQMSLDAIEWETIQSECETLGIGKHTKTLTNSCIQGAGIKTMNKELKINLTKLPPSLQKIKDWRNTFIAENGSFVELSDLSGRLYSFVSIDSYPKKKKLFTRWLCTNESLLVHALSTKLKYTNLQMTIYDGFIFSLDNPQKLTHVKKQLSQRVSDLNKNGLHLKINIELISSPSPPSSGM